MSFLKNLKEKVKTRLEKPKLYSYVKRIPANDVALLAVMCRECMPVIVKRRILITSVYAYYIPQIESDIDIAKDLFAKHGITMEKHFSHIIDHDGQEVLRANYMFCTDNDLMVKNMQNIHDKYISLYTPGKKEEKAKLLQQVMELRQNQKQ